MTHLLKLLASNRQRAPKLALSRIEAAAAGDETTIYIYDPIVSDDQTAEWWGGVSAQTLVPAIRAIKGGTIHLRINSPGGDVFAAQAICQAIKETGAKVIAHIDGFAASAATVIATAADEAEIADGAFYMIHNAWTFAMGNANDLTEAAALLSKVDGSIAAQYARKSGMALDDVRAKMDAETWFTADEAVEAGLVNRIAAGAKADASASWDLSAYSNAPKAQAAPVESLATEEHRDRQQQRVKMLSRLPVR
jgi:ATP-dependent Clp protease protease subunit